MDLLKSFISLLALINPVGAVPFFLSLTAQQTDDERRRTIRVASVSVFCVMTVTTLLGQQIIDFFGISVGSLETGGGIIMLLMAINMLNAQIGNTRSTPEERDEAELKHNVAVVPLAIPLLTGPGSISTMIVYARIRITGISGRGLSRSARSWPACVSSRCGSPSRSPTGSAAPASISPRG